MIVYYCIIINYIFMNVKLTPDVPTELAQLEERSAFNRVVVGSSPIFGEYKSLLGESQIDHSVKISIRRDYFSQCP